VVRQRCCTLCGDTFEIEGKAGRPRVYCFGCEPPGWSVVRVRGRLKLRRRVPLIRRAGTTASVVVLPSRVSGSE
jgi:hypothetical protein